MILLFTLYLGVAAPVISAMPLAAKVATLGFTILAIWITWVDFRSFRIPNVASLALAVLGALTILLVNPSQLAAHLAGAAMGYLLFWLLGAAFFRLRGIEHLGLGDAKLMFALILWTGLVGALSGLMYASLSALAYAVVPVLARSGGIRRKVPFGPFLCFGYYVVWLYGPLGI